MYFWYKPMPLKKLKTQKYFQVTQIISILGQSKNNSPNVKPSHIKYIK